MKNSGESGRSIIELLAVLCIMAAFTIGAIKLYQYGMDVAIAQNTYEDVKKRAMTSIERFSDKKYMFDSRPTALETVYGYPIDVRQFLDNRNYVEVEVLNVENSVCRRILDKDLSSVTRLFLNERAYDSVPQTCPSGKVNMRFIFHRSKQKNVSGLIPSCSTTSDCSGCQSCNTSTGLCFYDDSNCETGYTCTMLDGTTESACYREPDEDTTNDDATRCGGGDCWVIKQGLCVPDSSLCSLSETCEDDGWCN